MTQFQNQILHFVQDGNSTSVILSSRLCENSLGALRRCSGRTDKYSIFNETTAFVVRLSRTMNAVFTQSGRAKNLPRSYLVQYSHYPQNESLPQSSKHLLESNHII